MSQQRTRKKVMYATEEVAMQEADRIRKIKGDRYKQLTAYYCPKNKCWHLTSKLTWKDRKITELQKRVNLLESKMTEKNTEIKSKNKQIRELEGQLKQTQNNFESLKKSNRTQLKELKQLRKWKAEFDEIMKNR